METVKYACDCDRVIEMEEMSIGIGEILQYVRGSFSKDDLRALIDGLEGIEASSPADADDEE